MINQVNRLKIIANKIRKRIVQMNYAAGSGHPGGALSSADIIACLYFHQLSIKRKHPAWPDRDRFVLSKGHSCFALYAALMEFGIIEEKECLNIRHIGGLLQGHPDIKIPGVEFPSGSLGQGFSAAIGMALAAKYQNQGFRVYTLLGDGECNEGQVWEGAMVACKYKLDNLLAIVDYNKLQSDDYCRNVTGLEPLRKKWQAFNWNVIEIDGHNIRQILRGFKSAEKAKKKPSLIIAHTIKGKGVSFMEGNPKWHGSLAPDAREYKQALRELDKA